MPRLIVTDSGTTEREVDRLFVVDSGGTTRNIQRLFCIDSGGTARQIFAAFTLSTSSISDSNTVITPNVASASFALGTDGAGWGSPAITGIGSDYEVRLVKDSGVDPSSGPALNSWHPLSSARTWTLNRSGIGIVQFDGTLSIGLVGTSTALVTRSVTLYAEVSI